MIVKGRKEEIDLLHILRDQEAEIDIIEEDQGDQDLDQGLKLLNIFAYY
jgi:hypothetical protein